MTERVVLIGSSGHAKVVADVIEKSARCAIVGLVDSFRKKGEEAFGYSILGTEKDLPQIVRDHDVLAGFVAIGDNWQRHLMVRKIREMLPDFPFVSAVHPSAQLGRGVSIGAGSVVMAGTVLNPDSRVGEFCIVNTCSSVDHDCVMGDYSSLAPNCAMGGGVSLGDFSALLLGALVSHKVTVGRHCVVGGGAMVLDNVPDHCVAYGIPAKVIRERGEGEKYLHEPIHERVGHNLLRSP